MGQEEEARFELAKRVEGCDGEAPSPTTRAGCPVGSLPGTAWSLSFAPSRRRNR